MKSGKLNFLELSGPLRACNGTALPLPLLYKRKFLRDVYESQYSLRTPPLFWWYHYESCWPFIIVISQRINPAVQYVSFCIEWETVYPCVCPCVYNSVQNLLSSSLLSKNFKIKIHRTIILPVVLCGCETWSLTLREERKLRVFENMVLRRIFGPRRDEVTGEWRRLHTEELNDLYSSPNFVRVIKSRRMRWAGHVARMGE